MTQSSVSKGAPKSRHHFKSDLADTPLPEILYKVYRFQVPGILTARSPLTTSQVYIRGGHVVHARTSDREASLGAWALREGLLSRETYEDVMRRRESVDRKLGTLLVDGDYLSPDEVRQAIQGHTEAIVWSLFAWSEGVVEFEIGQWSDEEVIPIQIPVGRAIVGGIRREMDAAPLLDRLGGPQSRFRPRFRVEDAIEIGLRRAEFNLLLAIEERQTLGDLCGSGVFERDEALKLIYAFRVLDLVRPVD